MEEASKTSQLMINLHSLRKLYSQLIGMRERRSSREHLCSRGWPRRRRRKKRNIYERSHKRQEKKGLVQDLADVRRGHLGQDREVILTRFPLDQTARMKRLGSDKNCARRSSGKRSESYDSQGWVLSDESRLWQESRIETSPRRLL